MPAGGGGSGAIASRIARRTRRLVLRRNTLERRHSRDGNDDESACFASVASSPSVIDMNEFHDTRETAKKRKRLPHLFPKPWRKFCGRIVNNEHFQVAIVLLIAINAAMMGVATYDFIEDNPILRRAFEITDLVFLCIFTAELAMQFVYKDLRIFLDGWLVFDFVVIVMSWAFSEVQIVRAFRIFRAFRLIGRIEILRNLVDAVISVIPRMAAIGMLLLLIFYIFAVMFTQLFMNTYPEITSENYFGTLGESFFTLFQMMTMDGWADIAREVMAEYTWAWFPFIAFVVVSGFVVVNLIIAVICDAIALLHDAVYVENESANSLTGKEALSTDEDSLEEEDETDGPQGEVYPRNVENEVDDLTLRLEQLMRSQQQTQHALEQLILQLHVSETVVPGKGN